MRKPLSTNMGTKWSILMRSRLKRVGETVGLVTVFAIACNFNPVQSSNPSFSPSGTYHLNKAVIDAETNEDAEGPVAGNFGTIQVKAIGQHAVAMTFYVSMGSPGYNSGSFVDTLDFKNNTATYTTPEFDPSCNILFEFSKAGIQVTETTDNYNHGCGFGHAVVANGYFKKYSAEEPVLIHPLTGEVVQ